MAKNKKQVTLTPFQIKREAAIRGLNCLLHLLEELGIESVWNMPNQLFGPNTFAVRYVKRDE